MTFNLFGRPQQPALGPAQSQNSASQNQPVLDDQVDDSEADGEEDLDASTMLAQFFNDPATGQSAANQNGQNQGALVAGQQQQLQQSQKPTAATNIDENSPEAIQQLVQTSITNLRLPDDFAFEHLHSNDPREQRQAYQSLQQHAVISAIQTILPVMQRAFEQFDSTVAERIQASAQSLNQESTAERIFTQRIPAYANDEFKGMVRHLDGQLKARGVDDPIGRANRINQMLQKLGVTASQGQGQGGQRGSANGGMNQNNNSNDSTRGVLRGSAALESFFPAPRNQKAK